jgi:hypothetical protein
MERGEAFEKATQILHDESVRPTLSYDASLDRISRAGIALENARKYSQQRQPRPRSVHPFPNEFEFKSVNYDLLMTLYSQVQASERSDFIVALLGRRSGSTSSNSELALLAEFCVRTGHKPELIQAIRESPTTRGLARLLEQLEDTIQLNFNLFSDGELKQLGTTLKHLRAQANREAARVANLPLIGPPREHEPNPYATARNIAEICAGLIEQCKQARYFYLKGALQKNANLEVNSDKGKVESYLTNLGFSGPLLEALNAAEQQFRDSATPFELKSCLGHLRSFLEGLHEQACKCYAAKAATTAPKKWGQATRMLRDTGFLSAQEENFAASLYTMISDEGVHPLIAEPEYARLLRNVVIEYGLLFLTKLEKSGNTTFGAAKG